MKQGEHLVVGMGPDPHDIDRERIVRIVDQPQLAGRTGKNILEMVGRLAHGLGKAAQEQAPHRERGIIVSLNRLAKSGQVGPLVGPEENMAIAAGRIVGRKVDREVVGFLAVLAGP
jgi:hypothetical protein